MRAAPAHYWGHLFAVVVLVFVSSAAAATGNFVSIILPQDVSINLPKNWVILTSNQRITLDTAVQSTLDLSGIVQQTSELPFAANYYDDQGRVVAILNIRYYPNLDVSQRDARDATSYDIEQLDAASYEQSYNELNSAGMSMTSRLGTTKKTINGVTAFINQYNRASVRGPDNFRVRLVRVFAGGRSFTLTVSHLDLAEILLRPIADKIINSLKFSPSS